MPAALTEAPACSPSAALEEILSLIDKLFPLPRRFRQGLPGDVAELSRLLTSARPERDAGYLGRPNLLSAYLRFFLPWNIFRLCRIFAVSCEPGRQNPLALNDGDAVTDLGSGPLTLPLALWIARPELRQRRLEFRCIDPSGPALEAGKKLFAALTKGAKSPAGAAGSGGLWTIKTIRGPLETSVRGEKAKLVTAVNVFNEVYGKGSPGAGADRAAALLVSLCAADGAIFAAEPGNPRGGAFIAALRAALLEKNRPPLWPCTHCGPCSLPGTAGAAGRQGRASAGRSGGGKAKWCHFAFDTEDVPAELHRLSAAAGIPKERAVVSCLLAGPAINAPAGDVNGDVLRIRVVSDAFPLPGSWGRYGCSEQGLVLVTGRQGELEKAASGTLLELALSKNEKRDRKTGALMVAIAG
jgi:hypothetical protein